jgi:hypothetical protein
MDLVDTFFDDEEKFIRETKSLYRELREKQILIIFANALEKHYDLAKSLIDDRGAIQISEESYQRFELIFITNLRKKLGQIVDPHFHKNLDEEIDPCSDFNLDRDELLPAFSFSTRITPKLILEIMRRIEKNKAKQDLDIKNMLFDGGLRCMDVCDIIVDYCKGVVPQKN